MKQNEEKILLTIAETSERLGMTKNTVYELAKTKDFPCIRVGKRKFVSASKLNDWAESHIGKAVL